MSTSANPGAIAVSLQVRGLSKSYNGVSVLKNVSFEVARGETFAIMGPSGSGKSVLLRHLIGLEPADAGEILLDGQSIQSPDVMSRFRIAMVFQSGALLNSLTVGENVGLYLREHRLKPESEIAKIVAAKLDLVGLKGRENQMPAELSGGMRKRVAIARSLVVEPQLILYDEPTSELDPLMAVNIGHAICDLKQRTHVTSLLVSHDRDLALGVADRVAMIREGEIVFIGTPAQVRQQQDPFILEFLNADFKTA